MNSAAALDRATAALEAVRELASVGWDEVDGPEALETALVLARLKASIDGALVSVAERLDATGAADDAGWASVKDFLAHATGGRKGAGAGLVRVAKQTAQLPEVRAALAGGALSLSQAGVIAGRVATLPQAPELREAAATKMLGLVEQHGYDATDLDRAFVAVVKELDPDGSLLRADLDKDKAERGAHQARFLSLTTDALGGVRVKGYGTIEDAELIKTVLMPLSAPVTSEPGACGGDPDSSKRRDPQTGRRVGPGCPQPGCAHDGTDPREAGARLWDALVEACRRLQDTDTLPLAHGAAARITVTMSLADLQEQVGQGQLSSGESLAATTVRRLACDAEIIPAVLGTAGQVLDVGRTARLVTPGIWAALLLPRPTLRVPGLHPAPHRLRRPPHRPLGRRRQHQPRQHGAALSKTPHRRAPNALAGPGRPRNRPARMDPTAPGRRHRPVHVLTRPTDPRLVAAPTRRLTSPIGRAQERSAA